MTTQSINNARSTTSLEAKVFETLSESWEKRAAVRKYEAPDPSLYDDSIPDFPITLVPFRQHPLYVSAPEYVKNQILSGAWIWYSEKTIAIEHDIVVPGCKQIMGPVLHGVQDINVRKTILQTIIDEEYHTLMCLNVCDLSRRHRGTGHLVIPESELIRRLKLRLSNFDLEWEKATVQLAFMAVAELTINAYLRLLSDDQTIQPINRINTEFHRRDELSHSRIIKDTVKSIYHAMPVNQQNFFNDEVRHAISCFIAPDWSAWFSILEGCGIDGEKVLSDCHTDSLDSRLFRDYSGLNALADELGIRSALGLQ